LGRRGADERARVCILRLVGPGPWALGWAIRREGKPEEPTRKKTQKGKAMAMAMAIHPPNTHTRARTTTMPPPAGGGPPRLPGRALRLPRRPRRRAGARRAAAPRVRRAPRLPPPPRGAARRRGRVMARALRGGPLRAPPRPLLNSRFARSARLASPPSLAEEYTPGAPSALSDPPPRVPLFFQAEPSPRRTRGRGRCGTSACPRSCGRSNVSAPFGSTRVSVSSSLPLSLLPWVPTRQLYCIEILHWNACDKSCLL
jgi:hypothetical protein